MSHPQQPNVHVEQSPDFRENYANSVQIRVSVWDFYLAFGIAQQETAERVDFKITQGIYLSPQQAKALWNILGQNLASYEQTFGKISIEPHPGGMPGPVSGSAPGSGPVH
jgi:flagellar protein FlaG